MSDYDAKVRKMPLGYRLPCAGCVHLKPNDHPAVKYRCAFTLPKIFEGWIKLPAFGVRSELFTDNGGIMEQTHHN